MTGNSDVNAALERLRKAAPRNTTEVDDLEKLIKDLQGRVDTLSVQTRGTVDLKDEAAVKRWITDKEKEVTPKEAREAFGNLVRTMIMNGKVSQLSIKNPTVDQEMAYWRKIMDDKEIPNASEGQRALQQIPVFTGDGSIPWVSFEHPWLVAIKNKNLSEATLRTALISKLQGTAGYYYLTLERVEKLSFADVMEEMRKRYTRDSTSAVNAVSSIFQKTNEQVLDYNARILLAGKGLLPIPPKELAVLSYATESFVFPNPLYNEQEREYQSKMHSSMNLLTRHFLAGLRPEIKDGIAPDKYTEYQNLVDAAVNAEWMRDTVTSVGRVHHLDHENQQLEEVEENDNNEVNFIRRKRVVRFTARRPMTKNKSPSRFKQRKPQAGHEVRKATIDDQCFNCKKFGHFSKDCYQKKGMRQSERPKHRMRVSQADYRTFAKIKKGIKPKPGQVHFIDEGPVENYYDPEEEEESEEESESEYEVELEEDEN
jgi:hypothetical protein